MSYPHWGRPKLTKKEREQAAAVTNSVERGLLAAKIMARELRAEHRRWKMPLLTWKNGKVVARKP